MLRNSLRFRIIAAFCLFCIITGVTYTGFVIITLVNSEDAVFNRRVSLEIEEFQERYRQYPDTALPNSAYINGFIGLEALNDRQRAMVRNKPDGIHEYEDLDFHVGIAALPGKKDRLYVFYDTHKLEVHEERLLGTGTLMMASILFFLLLAVFFSFSVSGKVIEPVIRLADIIRGADQEGAKKRFAGDFYRDEVGFLAGILEAYLLKMEETIEAEKRFASDVSHELRTPVTTIKGAADVIRRRMKENASPFERPLERIERAVRDMENLIETFLALSRVREYLPDEQCIKVFPVLEDIVEQNNYLLLNKDVDIHIKGDRDQVRTCAPIFFKIVISNLIRNAFQYTRIGTITIAVDEEGILVSDTGIGIPGPEAPKEIIQMIEGHGDRGFGIGLYIVQRLCEKAGWRLDFQSRIGSGTQVLLKL